MRGSGTMKTCDFDGCGRPVFSTRPNYPKGLCRSHYMMDWKGKPLREIRQYNETKNGKKVCAKCQVNKSVDEYYRRPNGVICSRCKECMREDAVYYSGRDAETAQGLENKTNVAQRVTTITGGSK